MTATLTKQIAPGITVTVSRASARQYVYARALVERFGNDFTSEKVGPTVAEYWRYFTLCVPQTVKVEGMNWEPPGMFVDTEAARASFEHWLNEVGSIDAIAAWLEAVSEVNAPDAAPELTPEGVAVTDPKE